MPGIVIVLVAWFVILVVVIAWLTVAEGKTADQETSSAEQSEATTTPGPGVPD